jgi:hypothetical protein
MMQHLSILPAQPAPHRPEPEHGNRERELGTEEAVGEEARATAADAG